MKLGVLILGQRADPHVTVVMQHLEAMGLQTSVFDHYTDSLAIRYWNAGSLEWPFNDLLSSCDGVAVWSRVKDPMGETVHNNDVRRELLKLSRDSTTDDMETQAFWKTEWRATLGAMRIHYATRIRNARLVNPGEFLGGATHKILQLAVAREIGFCTPQTMVGTCADTISSMFGAKVLVKPIGNSATKTGATGLAPALLDKSMVLAHKRTNPGPLIYQEYIEKEIEYRVQISNGRVRTFLIDSQSVEHGKIDWRTATFRRSMFSLGELPSDCVEKLLTFMDAFSLDIAAFDLARDKDGRIYFFECNPAGQWLWLEKALEAPLSHEAAQAVREVAESAASGAAMRAQGSCYCGSRKKVSP